MMFFLLQKCRSSLRNPRYLTPLSPFQGTTDASLSLQARVWNLLAKGRIFEKFVQHPRILEIARKILGDDAQLGSIASNTIFPGG